MLITIKIAGSQLTCVEVLELLKRLRLNANDNTPLLANDAGIIRDENSDYIGYWKISNE